MDPPNHFQKGDPTYNATLTFKAGKPKDGVPITTLNYTLTTYARAAFLSSVAGGGEINGYVPSMTASVNEGVFPVIDDGGFITAETVNIGNSVGQEKWV